jgi:predicted metal-dependent hydrolase
VSGGAFSPPLFQKDQPQQRQVCEDRIDMKRSVRNRLADLLLGAFDDPAKRRAVAWLAHFCTLVEGRDRHRIPLEELLTARPGAGWGQGGKAEAELEHILGPDKLLRLCRKETGEIQPEGTPLDREANAWLVEPVPEIRAAFAGVRERVLIYARLVDGLGERVAASQPEGVLRRALADAARCFNAGLFFEAHEHLERFWSAQPLGPMKRFLQGIIQISVGFHHAHAGNYDGAVNQLAKGLEKTQGFRGEILGLDCDVFLPQVKAVRERLVSQGREKMRSLPVSVVPSMPIRA